MKNKKVVIILTSMVLLIGGILFANQIYNKPKNKHIPKKNNLAIMIKGDSEEYVSSNEIPKGNYVLNEEKTVCENGGKVVSYNNSTGQIGFSFLGSDRCSLYFDKITGTPITTLLSTSTADVYDENGLRYEGADPNNYICFDSNKKGACSNSSLLFRIIGLFDEEYSLDGTTSAGTKKLLKVLDTNNYGGTDGKVWGDSSAKSSMVNNDINITINMNTKLLKNDYKTSFLVDVPIAPCENCINNWSVSSLKNELNKNYLTTLLATNGINNKISNAIITSKWHLGGASGTSESIYYYENITTENYYKAERSPYATSGKLQNLYNGNPEYVYAKVGLMYPSDYGYATIGGSTTDKTGCRGLALSNWGFSDCQNNDWIFKSAVFVNSCEWFISPSSSVSTSVSNLNSSGIVYGYGALSTEKNAVRPTFYLDANAIKIVGGSGTSTDPYHIG